MVLPAEGQPDGAEWWILVPLHLSWSRLCGCSPPLSTVYCIISKNLGKCKRSSDFVYVSPPGSFGFHHSLKSCCNLKLLSDHSVLMCVCLFSHSFHPLLRLHTLPLPVRADRIHCDWNVGTPLPDHATRRFNRARRSPRYDAARPSVVSPVIGVGYLTGNWPRAVRQPMRPIKDGPGRTSQEGNYWEIGGTNVLLFAVRETKLLQLCADVLHLIACLFWSFALVLQSEWTLCRWPR